MNKISTLASILALLMMLSSCATVTSLGRAAKEGDIKEVEALLSRGANVNEVVTPGLSPLHEALFNNAPSDIIRLLLDNGADVNMKSCGDGWATLCNCMRPLHIAACKGNVAMVKLLVDRGAEINGIDQQGYTPLARAAEQGQSASVRLLIERGADIDSTKGFLISKKASLAIQVIEMVDNGMRKGGAQTVTNREAPIAVPTVPLPVIPDDVPYRAIDFGTYHALVIGNNEYRDIKKLHTAVSDAQAINALLQDKYGFKTRLLLNATRADILRALNDYRRRLGPRDNLLIYYAGHGWLDKDADQGYWLPVDATEQDPTNWISNGSITDSLRAMKAKHVLVIADSCYSGKLSRGINVRVKTKNYYEKISVKKARTVMASGGLEPVADEGGKGTHSVFASALIEALNENQGVIDTTLLFSQIRRPVMVNTDQTPEYSDIRKAGHDGGDFLFVRQK